MFRLLRATLVAVLVLSVVAAGRVAWVAGSDGTSDADLRAQAHFLSAAVDDGAAQRMQGLFPEGYLFTVVLTGLAVAASSDDATRDDDLVRMRELLALADSADGTAPFDPAADPPYGVFHAGWTLLLRTEVARLSGSGDDLGELRRRWDGLRAAVDRSRSGLLEAYPGQSWPVDTVVAVAALERARQVLGGPAPDLVTQRWLGRVDALRDPATGLLPHRTTPDGTVLQGPRASSQSLVQLFWPDIDPGGAAEQWRSYVDTFVVRRAVAAVGVREYPQGVSGNGDVDSGPLVLGMSASATVLSLGGARRAGDRDLAADLDREAELAGLPLQVFDQRRYLGGALPVGDAFLAFARAQDEGAPAGTGAPSVRWPFVVGAPLVTAACAAALLVLIHRRRCARTTTASSLARSAAPP